MCAVTTYGCLATDLHYLRYKHAWLLRRELCLPQVGKGSGGRDPMPQGLRGLL